MAGVAAAGAGSPETSSAQSEEEYSGAGGAVREQDRFLPIANVSRIMKKALPANAKISKEAKETVQECVSEFISFVTGEASDKCQREKRKTINGDDLLWAMSTLGFEEYVDPLKPYLQKFREVEGERANIARGGQPQADQHPPPPLSSHFSQDSLPSSSSSNSLLHPPNGANSHSFSLNNTTSTLSTLVAPGVPLHPQGNLHLYHPSSQIMIPYAHVPHAPISSTPIALPASSSDHQPQSQPRKAS